MKLLSAICITILFFLALSFGCKNQRKAAPPARTDTATLKTNQVQPKRAEGGKFKAVKPNLKEQFNEEKPYKVPKGPDRGKMQPNNNQFDVKKKKEGDTTSQAPLYFRDYNEFGDATPSAHLTNPEPSVAENGNTIMTTGNFWMSLSENGGGTWTTVNPTTIFPEDYGGFCCDQVLTYIPRADLFVWLLQYRSDASGTNAIRIAVASTEEVRNSNGTAWTYWDFVNTVFASSGALDYNDMSFGSNFLYWSSSVGVGSNRYVIRVPIKEMQARSTVNFQFTQSTEAFWSHVTQNGSNGVYWAGHPNNSTMKVYSMMDADGFYSWRDVNINSWPTILFLPLPQMEPIGFRTLIGKHIFVLLQSETTAFSLAGMPQVAMAFLMRMCKSLK